MWLDFRIFEEVPVAFYRKQYSVVMDGEMGRHKEAHVHIKVKGDSVASISIRTGKVLVGTIPKPFVRRFWEWFSRYQDSLLTDWENMQKGLRPSTYEF
jgi:hypothetical protein